MLTSGQTGGLGADLKAALGHCRSANEFVEDKSFDDVLGSTSSSSHLYGVMLSILGKNVCILKLIYEESGIWYQESDIFKLLKLCLNSYWPQGFLAIIKSPVTAAIFTQGSLDFKEELIRFSLIECERLCSRSVNLVKQPPDEGIIREVKDQMTEHPYNCLSWLYFDPIHKELKN
jgi:hypothetical protein